MGLEIRFHPAGVSVVPNTITPVGNYGISISWSDSHATGIYRFEFLRDICPCEACSGERAQAVESPSSDKEPKA